MDLGRFGTWHRKSDVTPEMATRLEAMGFGAIWVGGSPGGDLSQIGDLLDATERVVVATGIVNMWRDDAGTIASAYHKIADKHPGRFLLGVGIGHRESSDEYRKPIEKIREYLDRLDRLNVPKTDTALAALGPKALKLAGQRTAGAHPYLTTPRHTEFARKTMGDGPLLAPEHKVQLGLNPQRARQIGRATVSRYLGLANYRNNLIREGWTEEDLENGGSDRLVDALVLHGDVKKVAEGLSAHLEAGADHVAIHVLGDTPLPTYAALAGELL